MRCHRRLPGEIEALGTIEPGGPFERIIAGLLLVAYKQRLRELGFARLDGLGDTERVGAHRRQAGGGVDE